MDKLVKKRIFEESNYTGIYFNGKTIRLAIDSKKPITELKYPEFYDVKITDKCYGECPYCYMDSLSNGLHAENILDKIINFFGPMNENQRPFQVAIGGGEPTIHPNFIDCMKLFHDLGITPNYTTNGMFIKRESEETINSILQTTKDYCGGVAISCHDHLDKYWRYAASKFYIEGIKLNFHIIISDSESCDKFRRIYNHWKYMVDYFVLLPYGNTGRAEPKKIDWEYLVSVMPEDHSKIAFGANFHPYLSDDPRKFNVSLYEPESMSKFLDLKDMRVYRSSFLMDEIQ